MEIDPVLGQRFMSQTREMASLTIDICSQWEEYDESMKLIELSLSKQALELHNKEQNLSDKENESDLKRLLETDVIVLVLEMHSKQLLTQHKAQEELLQQVTRGLEAKEKELMLFDESIKEKSIDMEKKEVSFLLKLHGEAKEIESKRNLLEVKEKNLYERKELLQHVTRRLEAKEKELRLFDECVKEKSTVLEKKEENFLLKLQGEAIEIEANMRFLKGKEKKLGEREKVLELKQRELNEKSAQAERHKRSTVEIDPLLSVKKHKPCREHNHDDEEKETDLTLVLHGNSSSDLASELTIEAKRQEVDEPYTCPEPDFNEFNNTISSFAVGQVWSLYDPLDKMPRYYAQIKKILKHQMSLRVTWLEPLKATENEQPFPIACGTFKYGVTETIESYSMFAHKMDRIIRGKHVTITPRKGETWAVFRDWSKSRISHREHHKPPYRYDFVEVMFELDLVHGIGVAYLRRVEGFTSVYKHGEQDGTLQMIISCDEMLRFSHRVPSFRLNGDERDGVQAGYFELDPSAIPQALSSRC